MRPRLDVPALAIVIMSACLLVLSRPLAALADPTIVSNSKEIGARWHGDDGFSVLLRGVPLTRRSGLQVYAPGWTEGYYTSNPQLPRGQQDPHHQITARQVAQKVKFTADETVRLIDDRTIELGISGQLDSPVDARIEWNIGCVNAFALYGGAYAAGDSGGEWSTVLPEPPSRPGERGELSVVRGAKALRLRSRVGEVLVKVEQGPASLVLLDGRRAPDRWWAQETPTFWLGMMELPVETGKPFSYRVSMRFTPAPTTRPAAEAVKVAAAVTQTPQAFLPQSQPVQIIPKPKKLEWTPQGEDQKPQRFAMSAATRLILGTGDAQAAASALQREAHDRFAWEWKSSLQNGAREKADGAITFAAAEPGTVKPEGYILTVAPDGILVQAADARGHFYAAQTLIQMIEMLGGDVYVRASRVEDWPSLAFRGVHIFPGKDAMPLHRKLLERVLARHKINYLVLECSYTQWDTDRKIWVDISVPKEQIAEYVKLARQNLIEPIPLVQSLGHSEWMFKNAQNTDLAEDPEMPYAYSPTNPRTYDFILGIYREAVELFKPIHYFHIGHDEVTNRGRFPFREASKSKSVTELFLSDVSKLHAFFAPQQIELMMWGDMLLDRSESSDTAAFAPGVEEAQRRRAALPKGTVICDWHYTPTKPENYRSLKVFKDAGFKTVACPWYNPQNIYTLAAAARQVGVWGLLQTTWAGYSITDAAVTRESRQFTAYLLAAEYAWSDDSPPPDELPWRPDDVFNRLMNPHRQPTAPQAGFTLDLSKAPALARSGEEGWLGYGSAADLSAFDPAQRQRGFTFGSPSAKAAAVVLGGELLPAPRPRTITFELSEATPAGELAFLQATAFPARVGQAVGRYEIVFEDGAREKIPLVYGNQIRAWTDLDATHGAQLISIKPAHSGLKTALRLFRWTNPHPDKPIRQIVFTTDDPCASPALFGVTGLD